MSFILDALQRATAERERGHVPGLHSHGTATQARTGAPALGRRPLMLGATVLALAAALVWWWSGRAPAASPPAEASTAASQIAARLALAPPSPASALPILAPEPAPRPAVAPAPQQAPVAPPVAAPRMASAVPPDTAAHTPDAGMPPKAPAPVAAPARPASALPAYAGGSGPEVKISGATYSENPAHRMLIANGLVVHEGQDIAPDLKLEVIGPRGAVLNHRGTRYNIHY